MKLIALSIRILFFALFIFLLSTGKMMLWLGLFAVSLLASLLFGRYYCGYMCPMNTLMEPAGMISKKFNLRTPKTPKWLEKGYFAWASLFISLAAMFLARRFMKVNLPLLLIWLVLAVLITLRYKPSVFHNLICPFGALLKVTGKTARWSKKVNPVACNGCEECVKVCPSEAVTVSGKDRKAFIDTALCHQCINCQQACRKNAIHYSKV